MRTHRRQSHALAGQDLADPVVQIGRGFAARSLLGDPQGARVAAQRLVLAGKLIEKRALLQGHQIDQQGAAAPDQQEHIDAQ